MNTVHSRDLTLASRIVLLQAAGSDGRISAKEEETLPLPFHAGIDEVRNSWKEDPSVVRAEMYSSSAISELLNKAAAKDGDRNRLSQAEVDGIKDQQLKTCAQMLLDVASGFSTPYVAKHVGQLGASYAKKHDQLTADGQPVDKKGLGVLRKKVLEELKDSNDKQGLFDGFVADLEKLSEGISDKKTLAYLNDVKEEFMTRSIYQDASVKICDALKANPSERFKAIDTNPEHWEVDATMNRGVFLRVSTGDAPFSQRQELLSDLGLFQATQPDLQKSGAIWFL